MSRHIFDPEIASEVGVNAAVIYSNLMFWCEKNAANQRNIYEGKSWTYNSRSAFELLFPYLSPKQIRTALDRLVDAELVITGVFNKDARDRTKWYAVPALEGMMQKPLGADTLAPEGQALPDSKPDINKPPNPQGGTGLFSELEDQAEPDRTEELIAEGFDEFWQDIWPSHSRKNQKADCFAVYAKACKGEHKKADAISPAALNNAARRYIASVTDLQFLKGPLPWLNAPGWEAFMDAGDAGGALDWSTLTDSARRMLQRGQCPPSMLEDGQPNATAKAFLAQVAK